jgi:hypothetical protein
MTSNLCNVKKQYYLTCGSFQSPGCDVWSRKLITLVDNMKFYIFLKMCMLGKDKLCF